MHRLSAAGKTVLISSHLLTEVQQICTHVGIIRLGELVMETTVDALIKGQGHFRVQLDQSQEALDLIKSQQWGQGAHLDEHSDLITAAPLGRGRELNLFLVHAGFAPDVIVPATQDLEQIFLQLTGNNSGDVW
ncbi:hypothetical protein [Ktedonobacter robiniae]|nr:hypothetical protein [Ktedonobacter robiniae]